MKGEIAEFPANDLLLAKELIKHKSKLPLSTFDRNLIEERTQQILSDPQVDDAVKRLVAAHM
jgi:hypothetical protein